MGAYIVLREDEDLEQGLRRFAAQCSQEHRRPWTKRRYGYWEKPSAIRRRRRRQRRMNSQSSNRRGKPMTWNPHITLAEQFCRSGPTNAVGH